MPDFRFPERVRALRELIAQPFVQADKTLPPVDSLVVSHLGNAGYLTGFTGSNGLVALTEHDAIFVTDGRYNLQAAAEVPGFERVVLPPGTVMAEAVGDILKKIGARRVGFEAAHLTFAAYEAMAKAAGDAFTLVPRSDLVEKVRLVKDANEIAALRRAIALGDECFTFMRGMIQPGMTEKQVAWEMELFLRGHGAQRLGFDSIVGSGPNSALIHGRPSDRVLGSSGAPEFLLCDFGCELDGYCSDMTRTFILGGAPTDAQRALYDTVAEALQISLDAIRPGVAGVAVDKIARDFLTAKGYGDSFAHGLGHSLGRSVHDGQMFGQKSETVLAPGMVGTVEPGVYLEGFGGVRIEDVILVTESGCEVLTRSSKDLLVLGE
jgi:Xaa-Pro aminopeptidase